MKNGPRKLRVLLIDDVDYPGRGSLSERTLGTDDLEVIAFPTFEPVERPSHLMRWQDHLEFWRQSGQDVDRPELVVIDCHFDRDVRVPALPQFFMNAQNRAEATVDPRGLLHGAIQVARLLGMHPWYPFGFVVYSQDLPRLAADGYAVTLFGLLESMAGQLAPHDQDVNVLDIMEKRMLAHHRGGHPTKAWPEALRMYRSRLAEAFASATFYPDLSSWQRATDALRAFAKGERLAPPEATAVSWDSSYSGPDEVLLTSLFADRRSDGGWRADAITDEDVAWLDAIVEMDRKGEVCRVVTAWIDSYRLDQETGSLNLPAGLTPLGHGLALTLLWALDWTSRPRDTSRRTPTKLNDTLAIQAKQSTRAVQSIGFTGNGPSGRAWTLEAYLNCMEEATNSESMPRLHPWVRQEVRSFLEHKLHFTQDKWPPCFQPAT